MTGDVRLARGTFAAAPARLAVLTPGRLPRVSSAILAVVAAAAAASTVAFPSLITGVEAARGNLRGTALVVLIAGVPLLVTSMTLAGRGSTRAVVVWLGTLGFLIYQSVLFCFATPLNNLFLVYVAFVGVALWNTVLVARSVDLSAFGARVSPLMPVRALAVVALAIVVLNSAAWLARIIPAVFSRDPTSIVRSSGLPTNPVYVQDLAVWLPLLAAAAVATWRRRAWGLLVTGAMLTMFVLESITIGADQWFGSRADPASDLASASMTPAFAIVAIVVAIPLICYCRNIDRKLPRPRDAAPTR